jgi:Helix-turn-helix domain
MKLECKKMGKLVMSLKEIDRIKILEKVMDGRLTQKKASETLRLSLRQTKRLCKRYKAYGEEGLIHKSRGKPSSRKINLLIRNKVLDLMRKEEFNGFGPTLFREVLVEEHDIKVSREWVRKLMITEGRWKSKQIKKIANHPRRKRRQRKGELIQLDGSYEDWFEDRGPRCCLLVMIDDATSEIMEMKFVEHETTQDYFSILKDYISRYKCPLALYSDRHSIFKVPRKEKNEQMHRYSQFERAMKELEITMIHAKSPQAKGRVERANKTLQDRLIKKMRRKNISTIKEGNEFLEEYRRDHNNKFAKPPESAEDAHVELLPSINLEKILVNKEKRKIQKNLEIQYKNTIYQLQLKNEKRMRGLAVDVLEGRNGEITFEYKGKEIKFSVFKNETKEKTVFDHKELEVFKNRKAPLSSIQRHRRGIACNY